MIQLPLLILFYVTLVSPDPKILTGTCQCPKFGTTSSTLSSSRTLWVISQKKYEFTTQKKISNKKHGCSNIRLPNFMVSHNSLGTEKKRQVQVCTQLVIFFSFHMIELEHENLHLCIRLCVIISTILSNKPSYCHFLLCSVYTIRKPLIS